MFFSKAVNRVHFSFLSFFFFFCFLLFSFLFFFPPIKILFYLLSFEEMYSGISMIQLDYLFITFTVIIGQYNSRPKNSIIIKIQRNQI